MSVADRYRSLFTKGGRLVTIERKVANSSPLTLANVRARIMSLSRTQMGDEIAGGATVGRRKVLVLAEDVTGGFIPLKSTDAILVDSLRLTIIDKPDDQTHRDGETLLAYVCVCA